MEKADISTSNEQEPLSRDPNTLPSCGDIFKGGITNPNRSLGMLLFGDLAHTLVCLVSFMEQTMSGA